MYIFCRSIKLETHGAKVARRAANTRGAYPPSAGLKGSEDGGTQFRILGLGFRVRGLGLWLCV